MTSFAVIALALALENGQSFQGPIMKDFEFQCDFDDEDCGFDLDNDLYQYLKILGRVDSDKDTFTDYTSTSNSNRFFKSVLFGGVWWQNQS